LSDKGTILRFRHWLERHKVADEIQASISDLVIAQGLLQKAGTAVDATLIAAPSSTKKKNKARNPEMDLETEKLPVVPRHEGAYWRGRSFGPFANRKPCETPLARWPMSPSATACCAVRQTEVFGDAGYQGADKRPDAKQNITWQIGVARPERRKALHKLGKALGRVWVWPSECSTSSSRSHNPLSKRARRGLTSAQGRHDSQKGAIRGART
jgi:IS5 family transposase